MAKEKVVKVVKERKTKPPKKLKVERSNNKFVCTWKNGEDYDDDKLVKKDKNGNVVKKYKPVQLYYYILKAKDPDRLADSVRFTASNLIGAGGATEESSLIKKYDIRVSKSKLIELPKNSEKKTISTIDFSNYYPHTGTVIKYFRYEVRGNRKTYKKEVHNKKKKTKTITTYKPSWSEWEGCDKFNIYPPKPVTMSAPELTDAITCKFSYVLPSNYQHYPIEDIQWQGYLSKGGEAPDWDHPDKSGTRTKSQATYFTIEEDTYKNHQIDWTEKNYSYTRYVRIRTRGPGGNGKWVTKKHVYAKSKASYNVKASLTKNSNGAGYLVKVSWTSPESKTYPIDANVLSYAFATPLANLTCPELDPGEWTDVVTMSDTKSTDSYSFYISARPDRDQAMYVKIDTYHDGEATPGVPTYVTGSAANPSLKAPEASFSAEPDTETNKITLSNIQKNCEVPGSLLGIYYKGGKESGNGKLVGYLSGNASGGTFQLPEWGSEGFQIGLGNVAGASVSGSYETTSLSKKQTYSTTAATSGTTLTISRTPKTNTTISVKYSYVTGKANAYTMNITAGVAKTNPPYASSILSIAYNGQREFTCKSLNSNKLVRIDSISYRHPTALIDNIPVIYTFSYNGAAKPRAPGSMMRSEIIWDDGDIPAPPTNIKVKQDGSNAATISWNWNWKEADTAEISWADHADAWESNDEPQTYTISAVKASKWKIKNLEAGDWYFKVRLIDTSDSNNIYGAYGTADKFPIKISTSPETPTLTILPDIITSKGKTTLTWAYSSEDKTQQSSAEIYEATDDGNGGYTYAALSPRVYTTSSQYVKISPVRQGWSNGETHNLSVRVKSTANELSEYSPPKALSIAKKPVAAVTSTSLVTRTREIDSETHETEVRDDILANLPLTVTVTGAGTGGFTYVSIVRDGSYQSERPDGTVRDGFDGEVIASQSRTGAGQFTFDADDLDGYLDDGGSYRIIATVKDTYGQSDTVDPAPSFLVMWDHQAIFPDAEIEVDDERDAVIIEPKIPDDLTGIYELTQDTSVVSGKTYYINNWDGTYSVVANPTGNPKTNGWYEDWHIHEEYDENENWIKEKSDRFDIYRLSADKPELIVEGGQFGTKYVDPYPTYGQFGGHRVVFVSSNGDYTAGYKEAVADFGEDDGDNIDKFVVVIDSDKDRVILPYDITVSHKWSKDVSITKYLDGSIHADWNPAVETTTNVNTTVIISEDPDQIEALRRIANYPGLCHVRTPDGSSFTADVQINEDHEEKWVNQLAKFSLSITRVDNVALDGIKYEDWPNDSELETWNRRG